MCCGLCSSTLRSRNSSGGIPSSSRAPWPRYRTPGHDRQASAAQPPRSPARHITPSRPARGPGDPGRAQEHRQLQADRRVDQGRQADRERRDPPALVQGDRRPGDKPASPARSRSGGRASIASNRWLVPMFPAFAVRARPIATDADAGPSSGQTARARRSRPRQVMREGQPRTAPLIPPRAPADRLAASSNAR